MNIENYILDAIEIVSAWDIADEDLGDAIIDQARLMAGNDPSEPREDYSEIH